VVHATGGPVTSRVPGDPRERHDPPGDRRPDLATEITLQPVRRYGVDAAILYSDIMTPVHAIGFGVDIAPGVGPVVDRPFAGRDDLERLRPLDPRPTPPTCRDGAQPRRELRVPLIAFAGAPFTVASYLIEGRPSRTYVRTKGLMHTDEALWTDLMDRLADLAIASLRSQVEPGPPPSSCSTPGRGRSARWTTSGSCCPHSSKVLAAIAELGVPRIHFGVNTAELLGPDGLRRVPRSSGSTGAPRSTRPVPGCPPTWGCRATWTRRSSPPGWEPTEPAVRDVLRRAGAADAGTSSTWATASSPRPTPRPSNGWSNWSTTKGLAIAGSGTDLA
jgi:hypothetical protein